MEKLHLYNTLCLPHMIYSHLGKLRIVFARIYFYKSKFIDRVCWVILL